LISRYREYGSRSSQLIREISEISEGASELSDDDKQVLMNKLQEVQDLNDEKLKLSGQVHEMIETRFKDVDLKGNIKQWGWAIETKPQRTPRKLEDVLKPDISSSGKKKRGRKPKNLNISKEEQRQTVELSALMMLADTAVKIELEEVTKKAQNVSKIPVTKRVGKKKRRKNKSGEDSAEYEEPENNKEADENENEPLYCLCNRISFGDMVECDNEACAIEWFHFSCVGLKKAPKGKWLEYKISRRTVD
jgi:inhibitor of growth protein 1